MWQKWWNAKIITITKVFPNTIVSSKYKEKHYKKYLKYAREMLGERKKLYRITSRQMLKVFHTPTLDNKNKKKKAKNVKITKTLHEHNFLMMFALFRKSQKFVYYYVYYKSFYHQNFLLWLNYCFLFYYLHKYK